MQLNAMQSEVRKHSKQCNLKRRKTKALPCPIYCNSLYIHDGLIDETLDNRIYQYIDIHYNLTRFKSPHALCIYQVDQYDCAKDAMPRRLPWTIKRDQEPSTTPGGSGSLANLKELSSSQSASTRALPSQADHEQTERQRAQKRRYRDNVLSKFYPFV